MAKKHSLTEEDMEQIQMLYSETSRQSKVLDEILLCIKGSDAMNIEGIIPAQRRIQKNALEIENKLDNMPTNDDIEKINITLTEINEWKQEVSIYFGMILSYKVWKFIGVSIAIMAITVLGIKYGFQAVWQYIKQLFL